MMSGKARALQRMYNHGFISRAGVEDALADGMITQEEYALIIA